VFALLGLGAGGVLGIALAPVDMKPQKQGCDHEEHHDENPTHDQLSDNKIIGNTTSKEPSADDQPEPIGKKPERVSRNHKGENEGYPSEPNAQQHER